MIGYVLRDRCDENVKKKKKNKGGGDKWQAARVGSKIRCRV